MMKDYSELYIECDKISKENEHEYLMCSKKVDIRIKYQLKLLRKKYKDSYLGIIIIVLLYRIYLKLFWIIVLHIPFNLFMPKIHHKTHVYGRELIKEVEELELNLEMAGFIDMTCKFILQEYI